MSKKPRLFWTIVVATLGSLVVGAPSQAAPGAIVSIPGSYLANYGTPVAAVSQEGTLTHYQTDASAHDVVSVAMTTNPATWDPRYCPFLTEAVEGLDWEAEWASWSDEDQLEWITGDAETGKPPHPCKLLWSPLIYIGELKEVFITMPDGSPKLEVTEPGGTGYDFYCSIHPFMTGSLIVLPPEG